MATMDLLSICSSSLIKGREEKEDFHAVWMRLVILRISCHFYLRRLTPVGMTSEFLLFVQLVLNHF